MDVGDVQQVLKVSHPSRAVRVEIAEQPKVPVGDRIVLPPYYYLRQALGPLLLPHHLLNPELPPYHRCGFGSLRHVDACYLLGRRLSVSPHSRRLQPQSCCYSRLRFLRMVRIHLRTDQRSHRRLHSCAPHLHGP